LQINLPRLLYLPCFLDVIINFFKTELIETKSDEESYREAWFSFENAPLKWFPASRIAKIDSRHWPIGVLFDLHTAHDPSSLSDATLGHPHLPWSLTVHFQDYPKDILTRRESPKSLQDAWLNNLKEVVPCFIILT
jgi:autophagy-related protein 5